MTRREFCRYLGGAALTFSGLHWAIGVSAQSARGATIGVLNFSNPEPLGTLLRRSLSDLGYTEGRNLRFESRLAGGDLKRLSDLAAELVRAQVDVIVAYPTPAIVAAKQAAREIPIVMLAAGDPVGTGLVASLARPGGNVTGTSSTTAEAGSKTLEIIREILPAVRKVGVLANASDPFMPSFLAQIQHGADVLNIKLETFIINQPDELSTTFGSLKAREIDAVVVQPSLPRDRVADLARLHRVPTIAPSAGFATAGGLAAYSASQEEMARRSAVTIDKILKGSKPADLPVEQPTKFELIINLKTAKAIGLQIPSTLLNRADDVIE